MQRLRENLGSLKGCTSVENEKAITTPIKGIQRGFSQDDGEHLFNGLLNVNGRTVVRVVL